MKFATRLLFLALALMLAAGCAMRKDITETQEKTEHLMDLRTKQVSTLEPFSEVRSSYIDAFATSLSGGHGHLKGKKITLRENNAYLANLGDRIAQATGVVVRYSPDLSKRKDIVNTSMNVRHSGELAQLLDKMAAYYNISWEYQQDTNTIVFYYLKTKTYSLPVHLSNLSIETTITNKSDSEDSNASSGATTGGTTGESEQTVETDADYQAWDEFLDNVEAMITRDGSVVVSKGAGTITVTESPLVLRRIDQYMSEMQKKLSRQLSFNIRIYNVTAGDNWNVSAGIQGRFNDGYTSIAFGDGNFNAVVLPGVGHFGDSADAFHRNWKGSSFNVGAMRGVDRSSLVETLSGITQNNQPMPLQALRRTGYLAKVSTTLSNDQSETSLEPGQVVTGTSVLVIPHIQPDDTVNMEYQMTYSILNDMAVFTSGDNQISAPDVFSRSFMQRFQARVNSTVILAGYASDYNSERNEAGILNFRIGTGDNGDSKEYIVIVIEISDATIPTYVKDGGSFTYN